MKTPWDEKMLKHDAEKNVDEINWDKLFNLSND